LDRDIIEQLVKNIGTNKKEEIGKTLKRKMLLKENHHLKREDGLTRRFDCLRQLQLESLPRDLDAGRKVASQ